MRPFWRNQRSKKFIFIFSMLWGICFIPIVLNASEHGIIKNLSRLKDINDQKYLKVKNIISKNPKNLENLSQTKSIKIDPYFLESLIFNSKRQYIRLSSENTCNFLHLLDTGAFDFKEKDKSIMVRLQLNDSQEESSLISLDDFLNFSTKDSCKDFEEIKKLFSEENIKNTLVSLKLHKPKTKTDCPEIIKNWQDNIYTARLCGLIEKINSLDYLMAKNSKNEKTTLGTKKNIAEKIKRISRLKSQVSFYKLRYINNMCQSLFHESKFCDFHLNANHWDKVINGELPRFYLEYRCQSILKREKLSRDDYNSCVSQMKNDTEICRYNLADNFKSLSPQHQCDNLNKALNSSNLISNYNDCPAWISNGAIINYYRIMQHFYPKELDSKGLSCSSIAISSFDKFAKKYDLEKAWDSKYCFYDSFKQREVCIPTIIGNDPNNEHSQGKVVAQIIELLENKKIKDKSCKFISQKEFKPGLLEFKSGCFIVVNTSFCHSFNCPHQIISFGKKYDKITLKQNSNIYYFPPSYNKANFSLTSLMERKHGLRSKLISNISELTMFLKKNKTHIIHGQGCREHLYPGLFRQANLNQCTPVLFIIDGFFKKNYTTFVTMRTELDNVHNPKLVNWSYLYKSVKTFQDKHPLNLWTMYGLYN